MKRLFILFVIVWSHMGPDVFHDGESVKRTYHNGKVDGFFVLDKTGKKLNWFGWDDMYFDNKRYTVTTCQDGLKILYGPAADFRNCD